MTTLTGLTALLVVDAQQGFCDPSWGPRNNPNAEANIARLLQIWRQAALPVVHVHHHSLSPSGAFVPGTVGALPKDEALPCSGESIYCKNVNSAFIGTELELGLRSAGVDTLVIVGLTTPHCVSTTARMAGNLGFLTYVVSDATAAFDQVGMDGQQRTASDVHFAALSDLNCEFATVTTTEKAVEAVQHLDRISEAQYKR